MGASAIAAAQVDEAKERLILKRPIQLDALMARLYEPRVERVIRAIMAGTSPATDASLGDDVSYVRDLNLIRGAEEPEIANPIYREFLLRRRLLGADLLRHQEQHGPFTDEAPVQAHVRIFGAADFGKVPGGPC